MSDDEFLAEAERLANGDGMDAVSDELEFIAFAREAVPRLIAMVRERDARIAVLRRAIDSGLECGCRWCDKCIDTLSTATNE